MAASGTLIERFYPDWRIGTKEFYDAIRAAMRPGMTVVNLGAGPGDVPGTPVFELRDTRAADCHVIGCDPDPDVCNNPQVNEARIMNPLDRIPVDTESADLVFADWVLEHVRTPAIFLQEVRRVLKPGGKFLFRTSNRFHYAYLAAYLMPHRLHLLIANRLRNLPEEAHDPYPTFYRMNTRATLRRLAVREDFAVDNFIMMETEPCYLVFSTPTFLAGMAYERIVNATGLLADLRGTMIGTFVKMGGQATHRGGRREELQS